LGKPQLLQLAPEGSSVGGRARKLRLEYAGACYHVINRGNDRRHRFRGKGAAAGIRTLPRPALVSVISVSSFKNLTAEKKK